MILRPNPVAPINPVNSGGGFTPINNPVRPIGPTPVGPRPAPIGTPINRPRPMPIGAPGRALDGIPSFKNGTDKVTKTGPALLHKGEAVLKKDDADKLRKAKGKDMSKSKVMDAVSDSLSGKKEETPKKEIREIHIKRSATPGQHIIKHVHTHAEHPDEDHTTQGDAQLAQHVLGAMGNGGATPDPNADPNAAAAGATPTPNAGPVAPSPIAA